MNLNISKTHYGYIVTILSAVCFAAGAIIIKLAYNLNLTAWEFLTIQYLFSATMLTAIYFSKTKKNWENLKKNLPKLAFLGIFGTLATSATVFLSLEYIDAAIATVLFYTYPALVTLGSVLFFKEKLGMSHYVSLTVTLLGAMLTINVWNINLVHTPLVGIAYTIFSAFAYAFFNLYCQHNLKNSSALEVTTFTQVFATVVLLLFKPPFFLLNGVPWLGMFLGFVMAVLTSVFSFLLLLKGISLIGASRASIVSTFELPITMILAALILNEHITIGRLVGAGLIIASIIYLDLSESKAEKSPEVGC